MKTNNLFLLSLFSALFSLFLLACSDSARKSIPDKEISELKSAIRSSSEYTRDLKLQIDSIKGNIVKCRTKEEKFDVYARLTEIYRQVNTDSALHYAFLGTQLAESGSDRMKIRGKILTVKSLATAGIFVEASSLFDEIPTEGMDKELKLEYWFAGRMLYSYMRTYVEGLNNYYREFTQQYLAFDDSLLMHLPQKNTWRRFIQCERLVTEGQYAEAKSKLQALMKDVDRRSNIYGMAAYQLAEVFKHSGRPTEYATYLAIAARSDVECCVREGMALPMLADWLYDQGEMADAFTFINYALEEAMRGNTRMRTVTIAKMVPVIDAAYRDRINASRDELMVYFLLSLLLVIITLGLVFVLVRINTKTRNARLKLESLSRTQESYIGSFIGLCSSYAEQLDSFAKTVSRKIKSGQSEELLKLIESGKFGEMSSSNNSMFDKAFMDLYPDFVEGVNALLREEEQIVLPDRLTLTPELRIYAFVRLGVDESTRIAHILHYSVSTVYAYRNRMRNKARERATFDADVQKIGQF